MLGNTSPVEQSSSKPDNHMTDRQTVEIVPLLGGSPHGRVFLVGSKIIRGIYPGKEQRYLDILKLCEDNDLFRYGIVCTRVAEGDLIPGKGFSMYLEHERVRFITYAHEWPSSMLKDAALFHIGLNILLGQHDLVLSDMHPYNIQFNGVKPVYVDFPKICIFKDVAARNKWRLPGLFPVDLLRKKPSIGLLGAIYLQEFLPTFFRPLLLMAAGKHREYRAFVAGFSNPSRQPVISAKECASILPYSVISSISTTIILLISLLKRGHCEEQFWRELLAIVTRMDVVPMATETGTEMIPSYIMDVVRCEAPATLLVMGAGEEVALTAARLGSQVISVDSNEVVTDRLYHKAKEEGLSLTPVIIPSTSFIALQETETRSLLVHPVKRFHCEMVVIGPEVYAQFITSGSDPVKIAGILDKLAERNLLLVIRNGKDSPYSLLLAAMKDAIEHFFTTIMELDTSDDKLILWFEKKLHAES
jgi:hypothetical protein